MKFGYFDDNAKEYVITTPDTPLPWINYLGSQDFFSLIVADTVSTKMPNFFVSPVTATTIFR